MYPPRDPQAPQELPGLGLLSPTRRRSGGRELLAGRPAPPLPYSGLFGPQSAPCKVGTTDVPQDCLSKMTQKQKVPLHAFTSLGAQWCPFLQQSLCSSDVTAGKRWKTGWGKGVLGLESVTAGSGLALSALFCPFPHWHELAGALQNGVTFWGRKVKNNAF